VVVGEPQRAFYGNQFGNTFPLFEHYGVRCGYPRSAGRSTRPMRAHDGNRTGGPDGISGTDHRADGRAER
jgi:hypothetical protein